MKALITGASSGIGKDIALYLSKLNYDVILVARSKDDLEEVSKKIKTNVETISLDLSIESNCYKLYDKVKAKNIDILVNNAGFGLIGEFADTDLTKELEMIDLNIKTVHILTKLFLKDMIKRNRGYILNVSSSAAFSPGPLMATYYSTKAYILRLTEAIYEELRSNNTNVSISVLCPGPVKTNFNKVAGAEFDIKSLTSPYVAKYAVDKMLKHKLVIVPGIYMKVLNFFSKILPTKLMLKIIHSIQRKKTKR
jgi:short-subunit dehydrogenase